MGSTSPFTPSRTTPAGKRSTKRKPVIKAPTSLTQTPPPTPFSTSGVRDQFSSSSSDMYKQTYQQDQLAKQMQAQLQQIMDSNARATPTSPQPGAGTNSANSGSDPIKSGLPGQYGGSNGGGGDLTKGDVWDGFARRYVPGIVDWSTMPGVVLHDYLNQSGQTGSRTRGNIALEGDMQQWADLAPYLFNLMASESGQSADAYGDDDLINWMADTFLKNMTTPGGRNATTGQLLNMLFEKGLDKDNPLYDMLMTSSSGDPETMNQAIDNIMGYVQTAGRMSTPWFGSGMVARANRLANEYRGQQAKGNFTDDSFLEYLMEELGMS